MRRAHSKAAVLAVLAMIAVSAVARPQHGRHLLNPIYEEKNKLLGPETFNFRYRAAHPPAAYRSETKVRSEHPYVDVKHFIPHWVESEGATTVRTWDGAKLVHTVGKGGPADGVDFKFNSGKRAFNVTSRATHNANFDQTNVLVDGAQPLAVDHRYGFAASTQSVAAFANGGGPRFNNGWNVTGGPSLLHGRRLQAQGRKLLNPIYEEKNKLLGPETFNFRYRAAHPPAAYRSETKVRSEHPYVDVKHFIPHWVESEGATTVRTWDGAKLVHTVGKGGPADGVDFKFNSGKRAFNVTNTATHNANFDQTNVLVDGAQPLAVDHRYGFAASTQSVAAFANGGGPRFNNGWNVTGGPSLLHGRK